MWTIAYEMACYLATACIGLAGFFNPRYRNILFMGTTVLLVLNAEHAFDGLKVAGHGFPMYLLRFGSIYAVGSVYYLFRERVKLNAVGAIVAGIILIAALFIGNAAETMFAICGGYLIFWFSFKVHVSRLSRFANRVDLSYGLYLYAWPIQSLTLRICRSLWADKPIEPWILSGLSLLATGIVAYGSWTLIEKPCLRLASRRFPPQLASS
jgi:peptidoglycan/LPS O-acetylase OafA/YrhL